MSPRLPRCLFFSLCALALAMPATAAAAEVVRLDDPVTDNYKASYNADPSRPESRSWLALQAIRAAGTTWTPVPGSSIAVVYGGSIEVRSTDGRVATLTARVDSGPSGSPAVRVDPPHVESGGRWGLLITVTDRATHRRLPIAIGLSLSNGGATIATGTIEYRHDAALAGVAGNHIEYNGPSGRWYVGGVATRTEWEPTPSSRPSLPAGEAQAMPRITRIVLPVRTRTRVVALRVFGRATTHRITHVRVSIDGRGYGRWARVAPRYRLVLPGGRAARVVRVQLRDAAGRHSGVATRHVFCAC